MNAKSNLAAPETFFLFYFLMLILYDGILMRHKPDGKTLRAKHINDQRGVIFMSILIIYRSTCVLP